MIHAIMEPPCMHAFNGAAHANKLPVHACVSAVASGPFGANCQYPIDPIYNLLMGSYIHAT